MSIILGTVVSLCAAVAFGPQTFSTDEGCAWRLVETGGLRVSPAYIAAPLPGEDRAAWLDSVRAYRRIVREGGGTPVAQMNYDGVRAWLRLARPLARALELKPDDALHVSAEARWLEGNDTLCVAFDKTDAAGENWTGWSGVCGEMTIPRDGQWHRLECDVIVPAKGPAEVLRPICGMDATHSTQRGCIEIRALDLRIDDAARMGALESATAAQIVAPGLDRSIYERPDLQWASTAFTCHFTFMYDRSFYDPESGYRVAAFLDEGTRNFGGYDAVVLWHAYPRIGIDDRNQFDFYRDMPGGLAGLRGVVTQMHDQGVKVFIDYNPWDTGTRRSGVGDEEALADIIEETQADGIFLDTMIAAPEALRPAIDRARPGVVFEPEGSPAIGELSVCSASWAQWANDPAPPGMLHLKWLEPRHMQHQIKRWDVGHTGEIESAFFNGSGMLVWENVFASYNPWPQADRDLWRRAVALLRQYEANFTSDSWEPFHPTLAPGLFAHRWPGADAVVYTLLNTGEPLRDAALFDAPLDNNAPFYDAWNGRSARIERRDGAVTIYGDIDRVGCIVRSMIAPVPPDPGRAEAPAAARSVAEPKPVARSNAAADAPGMLRVVGGRVRMRLEHMRRECGCYPDPGTPPEKEREFTWGSPHDAMLAHDFEAEVAPFLIDECEVSNGEFKRFLDESGYRPRHTENFLKHWPNGQMPEAIADLPVVYVDLEDARAYAAWAGKRLPTEPEWHLAAQGTDGRAWPWGNEFDPARCATGGVPVPVKSMPEGRSPCGCYHMAGNVWEWTESERDDGHTRFAIVRGGSWYKAEGSIWYMPGGPQPNTSHAKFILMWPGLDRCATIGFRCVK